MTDVEKEMIGESGCEIERVKVRNRKRGRERRERNDEKRK